jgi:hypothetical protein
MTGLSPKKPGRPRKHASNAVKQLDDQTLSPIDSVALISMRPPKTFQKSQVLDPWWTLEWSVPSSQSSTTVLQTVVRIRVRVANTTETLG